MTSTQMLAPETCFYMNFKLLNIDTIFPKIMRAKFRSEGHHNPLVRFAGTGGQIISASPKFWSIFSNKVADKLTFALPEQMQEMGLTLSVSKVHCGERGFVVLRAELLDIDLLKLVEGAKGEEIAEKVRPFIGVARRLIDLDHDLVPLVQMQIQQRLETELPEALKQKVGFKTLLIIKASSEQADFFFSALRPHSCEVSLQLLNKAEAVPKIMQQKTAHKFGRHAGAVAAKVGSAVVHHHPHIFGKLVAKSQSQHLPEYAARLGVSLEVTEVFLAHDGSGNTAVRCDIQDVDLCQFQKAGGVLPAEISPDEHLLRLGYKGRQSVHQAVREHLERSLPAVILAEQQGLRVQVQVGDVPHEKPPEMLDLDAMSDDEGGHMLHN